MRNPQTVGLVVVIALGLALVLGWVVVRSGAPADPIAVDGPRVRTPSGDRGATREETPPVAAAPRQALRTRRFAPGEDHAPPPEAGMAPAVAPELHREFDRPDDAEAFVDVHVVGVLLAIEPGLDLAKVGHTCTDDGRHCTFEGPWLGDDMFAKWVRAISGDRTSLEALEGVRFSKFRQAEGPGDEARFVLEAHAP